VLEASFTQNFRVDRYRNREEKMGCEVAGRKKIMVSRGALLVLLMLCTMAFSWSKKSSSVEGKLVD